MNHERDKINNGVESLYRLYRQKLVHYARKILQNPEDAEDAVHQTFTWLMEKEKKIEDPDSEAVLHYLTVMTKHYAINRIRERSRDGEELSDKMIPDIFPAIDPGPTPLEEALDALPDRARDFLLLRFSNGWTVKEIADFYGMKPSAVRQALMRAKRDLKNFLREKEKEDHDSVK